MNQTSNQSESRLHVICGHCHSKNRVPVSRLDGSGRCGHCKHPLFSGQVVELDAGSFERHLQGDLPLLIDFWAPWCGPCQAFAPIYAQAASVLEPHVRCAKVNTENVPMLAQRFQIRSIPTLLLLRQGREVKRHSGAMSLPQLQQWLSNELR